VHLLFMTALTGKCFQNNIITLLTLACH